jgi:predicted DNA-binding protein
MEVHFTPQLEARLNDLAVTTGRPKNELVQDAVAGYLEELADLRGMLDGRYDDIKRGRVTPIDGEEAFAQLRRKSEARRNSTG